MKRLGGKTRRELFESLDRPYLKPLPETRYVLTIWENVTLNLDYHVEYDKHWYSAPYVLVHVELEARITATTVELYHRGYPSCRLRSSGDSGRRVVVWALEAPNGESDEKAMVRCRLGESG